MANLYANFLKETLTHTPMNSMFQCLNRREVPSAGKAMAKEKKNATTSNSRQGVLHIKSDFLGYKNSKYSEECGIVNYSLCSGGSN